VALVVFAASPEHSLALPRWAADGLAPEVTDLNGVVGSKQREDKLPDLERAFIDCSPADRNDGLVVGELGVDSGKKELIVALAEEVAAGDHRNVDSLLISHKGKFLFESYYRKGRANVPHYQMSISKTYTALALGRAIQLGYLTLEDLNKPVLDILTKVDKRAVVEGATEVTVAQVLNLHSGIRLKDKRLKAAKEKYKKLKGQTQIQAYFEFSEPINAGSQEYNYQGCDPAIIMQIVEAVVPGKAADFIKAELFAPMGITEYHWPKDPSGLPQAAAGSCLLSRDMLKIGQMMLDKGKWNGEQLIPEAFMEKAMSAIWPGRAMGSYGYFIWSKENEIGGKRSGGKKVRCVSGRGAGGQFILVYPALDLVIVSTSHTKGGGPMLDLAPERILPAFTESET